MDDHSQGSETRKVGVALAVLGWLVNLAAPAQVIPNPNSVGPFAPLPHNGTVSGVLGDFVFGTSMYYAGQALAPSIWVADGSASTLRGPLTAVPSSATPQVVPYSISHFDPVGFASSAFPFMTFQDGYRYNNQSTNASHDDPQGYAGGPTAPSNPTPPKSRHHRRHHLRPRNERIVPWFVDGSIDPGNPASGNLRLVVSAVVATSPGVIFQSAGVLSVDYAGWPAATAAPAVTTVWGAGPPNPNNSVLSPGAANQINVLSDLAPNVYTTWAPTVPNGLAWVTGDLQLGDVSTVSHLCLADYTLYNGAAAPPSVCDVALGSPFCPYATEVLVWTDIQNVTTEVQWILVPCRDQVEIYAPAPSGAAVGSPPVLRATIPVDTSGGVNKEICSNVAYFGPDPYSALDVNIPYFIVLERLEGETQGTTGGLNFIVFGLNGGFVRGPAGFPGLAAEDPQAATRLDLPRGFNDISIAPPERNATGGHNAAPSVNATAWFGAWDADGSLLGQPPFGGVVAVENVGLGAYGDAGVGRNGTTQAPVRYFAPTIAGSIPTSSTQGHPVLVGELSTNPILNPFDGNPPIVNQNLVAWYFENGEPVGTPSGYGVGALNVLASWIFGTPPGGVLITDVSPAGNLHRPPETVTERPLFGWLNYPQDAILYAQTDTGIRTFKGAIAGGSYALTPFQQSTTFATGTRQKRRHAVWQPPTLNQGALVVSQPTVSAVDVGICVLATSSIVSPEPAPPYAPPFNTFTGGPDDWPSIFVPWRYDLTSGHSIPFPQSIHPDVFSPFTGLSLAAGASEKATSAPPKNLISLGIPPGPSSPYYFGGTVGTQTPLWAGWPGLPGAFPQKPLRDILRTHVHPTGQLNTAPGALPPATGDEAWVGIGGNTAIAFSLTTFSVQGYPTLLQGKPMIVACHLDGGDPSGTRGAGAPRAVVGSMWTPEVNLLWYWADPNTPTPVGHDMNCVNFPLPFTGAPPWNIPIMTNNQSGVTAEIICTEITSL